MPTMTSGTRVGDRYTLGAEIGRGGRAVVYSAIDGLLGREVAVKVFHDDVTRSAGLKVQEEEARLAARMNHHALTTLFDAGIDSSDAASPRLYLVMERIPGLDLRQRIARSGALSAGQVACLGLDLAEGLQVVHEHGFLHRDIKPANVLIADRELDTRIRGKLTDFGISSIIGHQDEDDIVTGTAAYLSPEQVAGLVPTTASDVYSLGLVLLECVTGRRAFLGAAEECALARLDHAPHVPEDLPSPLGHVLRRMTAQRPADRPELSEVCRALCSAYVRHLLEAGRVDPNLLAANEPERVTAVREYRILDTPPDEAFDRITALVCRTLGVPIALIAIVDGDRAWFKSRHGFDIDSVDRNIALCAPSISHGRAITHRDVQADPAISDHPLIGMDPDVHGFASVPMRTSDGHVIGTLSVFDHRARDFSAPELEDLHDFAAIAIRELDLRLAARRAAFAG